MRFAVLVFAFVLTSCAATSTVTQPCEAPVVPVQPDYPIYRLKSNAPNDVTAMAFYESFSMCRTHSDNIEALLNALKGRSQ